MRARILSKKTLTMLALLAALGCLESVRAGGPRAGGEKMEITEVPSAGPVVVSNLNRLMPTEGSFKQVKEDLFRPFGSLSGTGSLEMDGLMDSTLPLPRPQARMSKRAMENADRQRNWAFTSYEELFAPQDDIEKKLFGIKEYGADGREQSENSIVDNYYNNLDAKNPTAAKQSMEDARAEFIVRNGFDPLGKTSFHTGGDFMETAFRPDGPETLADSTEVATAANGGRLGNAAGVSSVLSGQPKRLSELDQIRRSILGDAALPMRQPGQGNDSLTQDDYYSQKTKSAADNLLSQQMADPTGARQKSANPFVVADPTANVLHSHVNDDLTAKALGLPNPVAAVTNIYDRPPPTAQSVEAESDPFAANRMKRKF